jgi:imidazolonepropionase-like amidohydrolase
MILANLFGLAFAAPCVHLAGGEAWDGQRFLRADVVLEAGRVRSVGPSVSAEGCRRVDVAGALITPGLVEARSRLGLVEVDAARDTVHSDAGGDDIRASLRVSDAHDPRSGPIFVARQEGVLAAVAAPDGGFVSGQDAVIRLHGDSPTETIAVASAALEVNLRASSSRAEALSRLGQLLGVARRITDPNAADLAALGVAGLEARDLPALAAAARGLIPIVVSADRAAEIEAVLRFAASERVRVVINGAAEGWMVADQLAAAGVGVIVDPLVYGAGGFDQRGARADNAALLVAAGVKVAISTHSTHNARNLRYVAGNAVRGGMAWSDALRAITSAPAELFGAKDLGRIAPGAMADLVVWSGDPLEIGTTVRAAFVGGEEIALSSRQDALFSRWRTVRSGPEPLELPDRLPPAPPVRVPR